MANNAFTLNINFGNLYITNTHLHRDGLLDEQDPCEATRAGRIKRQIAELQRRLDPEAMEAAPLPEVRSPKTRSPWSSNVGASDAVA